MSDLCYYKDCHISVSDLAVRKGSWEAMVWREKSGGFGDRMWALFAVHSAFPSLNLSTGWKLINNNLGVDSGQLGIYDAIYYRGAEILAPEIDLMVTEEFKAGWANTKDEDSWYYYNCAVTLSKVPAGIIPHGCVSESGFGDGTYSLFAKYDQDDIIGLRVTFITTE